MPPEPTTSAISPANDSSQRRLPFSQSLKAISRRILAEGLYRTGLLHALRLMEGSHELRAIPGGRLPRLTRWFGAKFGILCYHRVGTEGIPLYSKLVPEVFEAQMAYLKKHYRVVSLGQLCSEIRQNRPTKPTLAITFDDGYRDLYTHAFPVLRKYEIPATIYLIGRCMETGDAPWYDRIFATLESVPGSNLDLELDTPRRFSLADASARADAAWQIVCYLRSIPEAQRLIWCATFERRFPASNEKLEGRMLDWDQVRIMNRDGISFGAHTMTHPSVSRLEQHEFHEEFAQSKELLESGLGVPIEDFAYPFGKPSDRSEAAEKFIAKCGYRSAVTTTEGFNSIDTHPLRLRRVQIGDDRSMPAFALNVARMFFEGPTERRIDTPTLDSEPLRAGRSGMVS